MQHWNSWTVRNWTFFEFNLEQKLSVPLYWPPEPTITHVKRPRRSEKMKPPMWNSEKLAYGGLKAVSTLNDGTWWSPFTKTRSKSSFIYKYSKSIGSLWGFGQFSKLYYSRDSLFIKCLISTLS